MRTNSNLKRFLCLALASLMLTPIISFATGSNTATQTDAKETFIDDLNSTADKTGADLDKVAAIKKTLALSEAERSKIALENAVVATSKEDIKGHSYVCSANGYELYLKKDTLSIIIRDEKTGSILESTLSKEDAIARGYTQTMYNTLTTGLSINTILYDPESKSRFGDYQLETNVIDITKAELDYKMRKDGFDVDVNFKEKGISLSINVTFNEQGFDVKIPIDSVKESKKAYLLANLSLFPLLGYTDRGEREGYMIVPDGNGIIVNFEDFFQDGEPKYKSSFNKRVYGTDLGVDNLDFILKGIEGTGGSSNSAEEVIAPYFGMVHTDTDIAVLGFISEGEESAYIESNINGVSRCFENYIGPRFEYRSVYSEPIDNVGTGTDRKATKIFLEGDIEINYLFTSGEDATYSGLANSLRELLLDKKMLVSSEDQDFDVRLDFLGVDKENFLVFRRNVVATTAENIADIIDRLEKLGVKDITAIYEGWQSDGVYNLPIYDFDADGDVGGNDEIINLFDKLKEKSIELYLMQDMLSINTSLSGSAFTSINKFNKKTFEEVNRYNEVFDTFRALFPAKTNEYIKELAKDFMDNGINTIAISGISDTLFGYTKDNKEFNRKNSMEQYSKALESAKKNGTNVILDNPYMYLWKYTDAYLNMPIGSSMYVYRSQEIPFLTSVLKGSVKVYSEYINFEANSTEYFLKLVETGVYPSFLLTYENPETLQYTNSNWIYSSEYEKYEKTIAEYNKKLGALNAKTKDAYIVKHERTDSNVGITTYSNGVVIYTNFNDEEVKVNDITIEGLNYKVGETE